MRYKGLLFSIASVLLFLLASHNGHAADPVKTKSSDPFVVVQALTDDMMTIIHKEGELFRSSPSSYYGKIQSQLESSVAFELIAKNVMGKYGSIATPQQVERFSGVFTRSLSETLGKGLANYSELKITTLPFDSSKGDLAVLRKVEVVQQVEAVDGTTNVSYTMAKNRNGEWKMVNVILNGINLGKQFRNQFTQAMKQNDNNIDKVIEQWTKPA